MASHYYSYLRGFSFVCLSDCYSFAGQRYYAIATPSATQRLLLGLLEAPPSWAPDALDASVQLVELLRAAEDYASGMRVRSTFLWTVQSLSASCWSVMHLGPKEPCFSFASVIFMSTVIKEELNH